MNDPFAVGGIQGVSDLDSERQSQLGFYRSPADTMFQRQPVQKLHSDESIAMLVVNFIDGADVRMVQRGSSLGLALKTRKSLRVFGNVVGQELKCNKPPELQVLALINHTHTTTTELLNDTIVRDGLADHGLTNHGIAQW